MNYYEIFKSIGSLTDQLIYINNESKKLSITRDSLILKIIEDKYKKK